MRCAILFLCAFLVAAAQQVRVNAQLSQESVRVGENVILSLTVEMAGGGDVEFKIPELPASLVIAGTQESTHMQYSIPGGRRRVITRELILQPTAPGTFVIPGTEVDVAGTVYRTRALTLQVSNVAAASPALPSSEAWLRVSLTPD
ncbi:MAG TPA: BatD family protein, partial [Longimicrobiales bacterium]